MSTLFIYSFCINAPMECEIFKHVAQSFLAILVSILKFEGERNLEKKCEVLNRNKKPAADEARKIC